MGAKKTESKSWKNVRVLKDVKLLIDYGLIMRWDDIRFIQRVLSSDEQKDVMRHFAVRFTERAEDRLASEIIIESILIWFAQTMEEALMASFLQTLLDDSDPKTSCRNLVETALTSDIAEQAHQEEIFSMGVALICELGIAIFDYDRSNAQNFPDSPQILSHITTFLLSVSNTNNTSIRLALMHYFGHTTFNMEDKSNFNKVLNRFGHTVLDHLFSLLFEKKTEAISLQFLLGNLPFVLEADTNTQKIIHETFKYYMLKKPERFALFLQTFSSHLNKSEFSHVPQKMFIQHLGALFAVASDVNHKTLAREILQSINKFYSHPLRSDLFEKVLKDDNIRVVMKDMVKNTYFSSNGKDHDTVLMFRTNKRGRKPSFTKSQTLSTLSQINFLGQQEISKAS